MFFTNKSGQREIVYGSKPYENYERALLKVLPDVKKQKYDNKAESLFKKYNSLTANEYSQLSGIARLEAENALDELVAIGMLSKYKTKNGAMWRLK